LIIILSIILLVVAACIKLTRNNYKKDHLVAIQYLDGDGQQSQQLQHHDELYPFTFSFVPATTTTDQQQAPSVYYIKQSGNNDLPPSYEDVVGNNTARY
jgi:hypothetical protein